jgi:hypothetical protein
VAAMASERRSGIWIGPDRGSPTKNRRGHHILQVRYRAVAFGEGRRQQLSRGPPGKRSDRLVDELEGGAVAAVARATTELWGRAAVGSRREGLMTLGLQVQSVVSAEYFTHKGLEGYIELSEN